MREIQIKYIGLSKYWQRCVAGRLFTHFWCECTMIQCLWEKVWQFLISLNILLLIDLAILLPDIQIREMKTYNHENILTSVFIANLFIIPQTGNNSSDHQQKNE